MAEPYRISDALKSDYFAGEPLDEKFKILDSVRDNNLTHMSETFAGGGMPADKYGAEVERHNWAIANAKNKLIQGELQTKLEDYASDNDMSVDAARDELISFQQGKTPQVNEGLSQILEWSKEKTRAVEESSQKAGFSGFNNLNLETDTGTNFGEGRIFQSADGKTQAAVKFATDENGQYAAQQETVLVPLPNNYESEIKALKERENVLAANVQNQKLYDDIGERRSFDEAKEQFDRWELELNQTRDKLARYTDGARGKSEFFKDKLDEQIRADDGLRARIPQGSNMLLRPFTEGLLNMAEQERRMMAGVNMGAYAVTGNKDRLEDAKAWNEDADSIAQGKEYYGMGQTRHTPGIMAGASILLAEELPQMALEIGAGAGASLLARPVVKAAAAAATRNAFAKELADVGLQAVATQARDTLVENATRRWGAKVGAAIGAMPGAAADAASNLTEIFDRVDGLNAEATALENAGKKDEAKKKREEAITIEGNAGKAFLGHFGSSYGLEFLPLERVLRRNEKALDMTENVFAAAEREVKGVAAEESLSRGAARAQAFRDSVNKWADSRFGKRTMEALKGGSMEAITEVMQSITDNKIAQEFYNENRGTFDGVGEAALGGAFLGAMVNWVATRTDKGAIERAIKQEVHLQNLSERGVDNMLSNVKGKEVGGVVAEAPTNVVQKVGATYRVIDKDMPEDTGFQNIEFKSQQEAEAFAEHRWQAYTTNQINNALSQTKKDDGSDYTKQEIDDQVTVATTLVNSVADRNNMSRETLWKSMADSVTFQAVDPALSAQDVPDADVLNALTQIENSFNENPSDPEASQWGDEIQNAKTEIEAWMALPEEQRGERPKLPADLALAVKHVHDMNKNVPTAPPEGELNQGEVGKRIGSIQTDNPYHAKDTAKANQATKFIGEGSSKSSTEKYRQAAGELANTGEYTPQDKVFVSAEGNRKGRKEPNFQEIGKAVAAGSTIITDTPQDRSRPYNIGEQQVADFLQKNGYQESSPGQWTPTNATTVQQPEQAPPFEVWKSSVRRRFAPDAEPSEVELTEIKRLQEVFGEDAPVNPDGSMDVIGALETLSQQEGPMGELAGLLSDILPTLNLSDKKLKYRMGDELDSSGVTSPSQNGDMVVGQSDKSTKVGTNTGVVEFLHHLVSDTLGVILDNYTASVGAAISQRPAMQVVRPPGQLASGWRPGGLSAENTPAGIEARVAYETAMPFAMVQRNDSGANASAQSGATMKQMFVFNELSSVLGGRPQDALTQAVVNGDYAFGVNRPTQATQKNFYLQTVADGRVVAWGGGAGRWQKLPFQKDDKAWKKYQFDTGWESRLARLYLREVMTSGMYDALFDPEKGLAGTQLTRSDYLGQYGPDAPNYNLTSFSRFVQGVIMDPVFAMRVSKARYGFPAINIKDMVFGDVVNNALGARTMEPDPVKRFALSRALSMGQQVQASKIPATKTTLEGQRQYEPQAPSGINLPTGYSIPPGGQQPNLAEIEGARGPKDKRTFALRKGNKIVRVPYYTMKGWLTYPEQGGTVASTSPTELSTRESIPSTSPFRGTGPQMAARKESAQNYAISYQGTRQDATGEAPLGTGSERTPDQIDATEMALRTPSELAFTPSGRFVGEGATFNEDEGRAMYNDVPSKGRLAGEDLGMLTEEEDLSEEDIQQLNESLDADAQDYYQSAFEAMAEKAAEESEQQLPTEAHVVVDAINRLDLDMGAEAATSDNSMVIIDSMIDSPNVTVAHFNGLLAELEGQVSDDVLKELAQRWVDTRLPDAIANLKNSDEYKNAAPKTKGEMYRGVVAEVMPKGMTQAQSTRLGGDPIPEGEPDGSGLRRELAPKRDVLVEKVKAFSKSKGEQVEKLVGRPILGVPANQVLAVTGEDPINVLLEHVRGLEPDRLAMAHDAIVALSEEFGFMPGDTLENSLGQIRLNPQDGASWLSAERVLSALRASKNPVAIVESMPSALQLKGVLWGLAQNPQQLSDAHALATAFTDSVALKYGEMGFQVKTKEVEEGDEAPKDISPEPGEEGEEGQIGEDESGFVVMEGPRPGPSNEFINRASRYNIANKGGNSTRIFPVGLRPFVEYKGNRVAISENTRWSKLDNRSVADVYSELADKLGEEANTQALDKLYMEVWRRALSGQQGLDALAAMKDYVMKYRLENGTDLPLVSPETNEARTTSPAQAISTLLNTELAQKAPDENPNRRGFINTSTRLITILQSGDPTTFIHELTHWLRLTKNGEGVSLFDVALGKNREAFMEWATDDGKLDPVRDFRAVEERIASGMESYLAQNQKKSFLKGADKKVQNAFARLAQTFRDIYNGLANMIQLDARARKGFEQLFMGGSVAQEQAARNPNLSITEMNAKRSKLVSDVVNKHAQQFYNSEPRIAQPFDDWKPAFAEDIENRGERLSKFVRFLENEGYVNSEEARLLRWVPATLPGVATNEEVNEMMRAASAVGLNAPTKEQIGEALNQEAKAPRELMPRTVTDDATQYPGDPVTMLYSTVPANLGPQPVSTFRAAMRLGAKKFNRWFKAQGNAPWSAFNILLERNGLKSTIERDMVKIMKMAEDAIEKYARAAGFNNAQDARASVHRDINAYLIEQDPVTKQQLYTALPNTDIKKAALRMRQYVDGLSIYLTARGVVRGPLASAINAKVGFYLHRSYQINSDPDWKHNLENGALKGVWEKAIGVIAQTRNISRDEAYNVGHQILSTMGFQHKPEVGGINVDATILMSVSKEFADIQKAADMILGLKEDPVNNFVKTIEGMAQLISQHEFTTKILNDGIQKGYIRDKNAPITAKNRHLNEAFFGDTEPVSNDLWLTNPALAHQKTVLAGKFTTPEVAQWMTDTMQSDVVKTALHRSINTINAIFKTSNTVHNWVSGLRNIFSANVGLWGQGHTGKYLGKATSMIVRDSGTKGLGVDEALMRELLEHNIAESATMAEIRDYSKRGFNLESAVMSGLKANAMYGTVGFAPHSSQADKNWREGWHRFTRGFLKYDSFRKKVYAGTDVVAKVAAYLEEKDRVQNMMPGLTPKQIQAEAARRVHMTMFSFDMLPKAVNAFRTGFAGILWGPFVSFPYSMARVYVNSMAIGYGDMVDGYKRGGVTDPQFLDGSRRLGALTAAAWGARMATVAVNAALGWEEEDEAAARKLMAPWDRDGNILFLSARGGEFSYINLSSLMPFNYITDAIAALVGGVAKHDQKSFVDPVVDMMGQIVKPFMSEQFFLDAVSNAAKNSMENGQPIVDSADSLGRNLSRLSSTFIGPLTWGDARNLVRLGIDPGQFGQTIGVRPNRSMDAWAKTAYALGFKVTTLNVEQQFPYQVKDWINQYKTSTAGFYATSMNKEPVNKDDFRQTLEFAQARHKEITQNASMMMNTLMTKFGLSEDAIEKALDNTTSRDSAYGKLNLLQKQAIWDGEWTEPITISTQQYYNIENAAEGANQPDRMIWIDDLMNEGLLDVQSGR